MRVRLEVKHDFQRKAVDEVIDFCAAWYEVPRSELMYTNKTHHQYRLRKVAIWLARDLTNASFTIISRAFRYSDHTAILRAIDLTQKQMAENPEFRKEVMTIREKFLD